MAYTAGPGLVGALLVGASCARALAWALDVPAIGVHHMEGHLLAPLLEPDPPQPPFVALLVSGGHSMLIEVAAIGHYRLLGDTLDDAAGEAFDKTAKLMDLGYPGGPALAKLAESGTPGRFKFSRPMTDRPGLDFSFSGLKTQVLLAYQAHADDPAAKADIARGFEDAIVDTLAIKCRRALEATGSQAPGHRRRRRRQSHAARAARRGRRARGLSGLFSAPGVLHRQRRDDRAGRRVAPAGRPARRRRRSRCAALGSGEHSPPCEASANDPLPPTQLTARRSTAHRSPLSPRPPTRPAHGHSSSSKTCASKPSSASTTGSARSARSSRSIWKWRSTTASRRRAIASRTRSNYKAVSKRLIAFVENSSFQLVETLAERCAEIVLERIRRVVAATEIVQARRGARLEGGRRGDRARREAGVNDARLPEPRFEPRAGKDICARRSRELRAQFGDIVVSPVYRYPAVGFDGPDFLNLAVGIDTDLEPQALNDWLHALEDRHGRRRDVPRFSSRTLDIDIVLYGDLVLKGAGNLEVPRAELMQAFVLQPLADIAPEAVHPALRQRRSRELWSEHP